RLKPYKGSDELQVVFHAVLEFFEQEILVPDLAGELLSLSAFARCHVNKGGDTIFFQAILALDHTGIDFDQGRFCPQLKRANGILIGKERPTERNLRIVLGLEHVEKRPGLALYL